MVVIQTLIVIMLHFILNKKATTSTTNKKDFKQLKEAFPASLLNLIIHYKYYN